jgi:predicted AlkP superfamily pyrophosphatase or phosphodiesterase
MSLPCCAAALWFASLQDPGVVSAPLAPPVPAAASSARAAPAPRLIVFVVVDQLIPEQLERLHPRLDGGLGRFVKRGTWYRDAWIDYAVTVTAPGHATLSTGVLPHRHGVVANEARALDDAEIVATVADANASRMSSPPLDAAERGGASSGACLRVDGLCDWVRAAAPASRSFSVSIKDRAAILLAGRKPELAVWWDGSRGGFTSSSYYVNELPAWLAQWNAGWIERAAPGGKPWRWENEIPGDALALGAQTDDQLGEAPWFPTGNRFPHVGPAAPEAGKRASKLAAWVPATPLGDAFCIDAARRALVELDLGRDDVPDVLCVSLSGCDGIGHQLGPYSLEVTDLLLRDDRALESLFAELDARVGPERWIAALGADHGVLDLPERLAARGLAGKRIAGSVAKKASQLVGDLVKEAGVPEGVLRFDGQNLFLQRAELARHGVDAAALRAKLKEVLAANLPCERVYTSDELAAACALEDAADDAARKQLDPWLRLAAHSFDAERSPDLCVQYPPWQLYGLPAGTTHGSPYDYDRHVPLAFLGPGFEPREDWRPVRTVDALPTLLEAAGLPVPPELDGRSLLQPRPQ